MKHCLVCIELTSADVHSEEEEPDADQLIAAALSEARGQEGTYPNPHRPGPIDPQVHVSVLLLCCLTFTKSYVSLIYGGLKAQ